MIQINENAPLSRKEREKISRQEEILHAARVLFSQKGYHDTTLEEIAHKAEFAKGTIYNYFANKDELFFGIVESIFSALYSIAESTLSVEGVSVRAKLTEYAKKVIRYSLDQLDLFNIMMHEGPRPSLADADERKKHAQIHQRVEEARELLVRVLSQEMSAGRLRAIDPRESALLFDGMLKFYCMHHVKSSNIMNEADIERAAELIVSIFFDGIQLT